MKLSAFPEVRAVLLFVAGLTALYTHGQNLVPNPGFEEDDACDRQQISPSVMDFRVLPRGWRSATSDSATSYNRCYYDWAIDPLFNPRAGDGLGHGWIRFDPANNEYRTFLQTRLTSPLEQGCTYEVSIYIKPYGNAIVGGSVRNGGYVFAKGLGVYLSEERVYQWGSYSNFLNYLPQIQANYFISDTTKYTEVSGPVVSNGGEEYLTLGFFIPNAHIQAMSVKGDVGYDSVEFAYSVEDVSVIRIPSQPTYKELLPEDTIIDVGDEILLSTGEPATIWSTGETGSSIVVNSPGKYWAMIEDHCYVYLDSINIVSDEIVVHIPNSFTPNGDGLNEVFEVVVYGVNSYRASIYNRWGKIIYEHSSGPGKFSWDGKFNGREAPAGVYMLRIDTEGKRISKLFSEMIHLIR